MVILSLLNILMFVQTSAVPPPMSTIASGYLNEALDLMQNNALHRKEIDWSQLRRITYQYAIHAQTAQDTYPAIVFACTQLKDHSSHLDQPSSTLIETRAQSNEIESQAKASAHRELLTRSPQSPFVDRAAFLFTMINDQGKHYAYLQIPFSATRDTKYADPDRRHRWAEQLFGLVQQGNQEGAEGWILDIRGNRGGYLDPMLAGLQSLLGQGTVLSFRSPTRKVNMAIKGGNVVLHFGLRKISIEEHIDEPVDYKRSKIPVVILLDHKTESAAETLAMAFEGRENADFIGSQTAGLTDSGEFIPLSDGAVLSLITQRAYDRRGRAYPEGIPPDQKIIDSTKILALLSDPAVTAAREWLSSKR